MSLDLDYIFIYFATAASRQQLEGSCSWHCHLPRCLSRDWTETGDDNHLISVTGVEEHSPYVAARFIQQRWLT